MNTEDVLKYGHLTVMKTVEGLDERYWNVPGVCGVWSVREIIAHLASFECTLVDVLNVVIDPQVETPTLQRYMAGPLKFNDDEVARRKDDGPAEVLAEYQETHARNAELIARIPQARRRLNGLLPWYGKEYDLEDFLIYSFYGHKREHCAQINVYRDTLE